MCAYKVPSGKLDEIVQRALSQYGVTGVDTAAQIAAWSVALGRDVPGFQVPDPTEGLLPLESAGVQPSWLAPACDDAVYGAGAERVVVIPYKSDDVLRIVAGSQRAGTLGYLAVMRESVAVGLVPVVAGGASVSEALFAALRVKDGSFYLVLHECMPVTDAEADAMVLNRATMKEVEALLAYRKPLSPERKRDVEMTRRVMSVEFPKGYCYLHAVHLDDRVLAVRKLGGSPSARGLLQGLGVMYRPSSGYSRGQCSAVKVSGVWHLTDTGASVASARDARSVLMTDTRAEVGATADERSPMQKFMEAFGGLSNVSSDQPQEEILVSEQEFVLSAERASKAGPKSPRRRGGLVEGVSVEGASGVSSQKEEEPARFDCEVCGFDGVLAEGHEGRCRPPTVELPGEKRLALVGDGQVALDVKMVIASLSVPEKRMTIEAADYLSASAQRRYMEKFYPGALGPGRSDHSWSTAFEVRYHGAFRVQYLQWFWKTIAPGRELLKDITVEVSKERTALQVLGLVPGGALSSTPSSTGSSAGSEFAALSVRTRPVVSYARKAERFKAEIGLLLSCEVKLREKLREEYFRGSFRGDDAYVAAVKSPEMAGYRRSFRSLLALVVGEGAVQEFHLAAQYRGAYVLAVLYGLVSHLGVPEVDIRDVGEGFANIIAGEYGFLLPLPKGLYARAADYTMNVCAYCSRAHWMRSNLCGGVSQGCGMEGLERATEAFYANLLATALVE